MLEPAMNGTLIILFEKEKGIFVSFWMHVHRKMRMRICPLSLSDFCMSRPSSRTDRISVPAKAAVFGRMED
jgi:hypothetical protein